MLPQTSDKGKTAGRKEKTWRTGRERGSPHEKMALANSHERDFGFPFRHCAVRMAAISGNRSWTAERTERSNPIVSWGLPPPHLEGDLSYQIQPPETEKGFI